MGMKAPSYNYALSQLLAKRHIVPRYKDLPRAGIAIPAHDIRS